jgi:hypothetical protein
MTHRKPIRKLGQKSPEIFSLGSTGADPVRIRPLISLPASRVERIHLSGSLPHDLSLNLCKFSLSEALIFGLSQACEEEERNGKEEKRKRERTERVNPGGGGEREKEKKINERRMGERTRV